MCSTNNEKPILGKYADLFNASTNSLADSVEDPVTKAAIENLQKETFKALRLLENDVLSLSK